MVINVDDLPKEKAVEILKDHLQSIKQVLSVLKEEHDFDIKDILEAPEEDSIPITAFKIDKISSLEIIVKYLKENRGKTYHEIAVLLNRNDRTIWATYNNSKKKYPQKISPKSTLINIPVSIISDRKYSVLESIVLYLKDIKNLPFKKISLMLAKDYQTIWTSYRRGVMKK